jgi:toxin ParE1/3/4
MPEPIVSPTARADLDAIVDYIFDRDPDAAEGMNERITKAFYLLARMPFLGRVRAQLGDAVRSFAVGNYVILYRPVEDTVEIAHVYHGRRDIVRMPR